MRNYYKYNNKSLLPVDLFKSDDEPKQSVEVIESTPLDRITYSDPIIIKADNNVAKPHIELIDSSSSSNNFSKGGFAPAGSQPIVIPIAPINFDVNAWKTPANQAMLEPVFFLNDDVITFGIDEQRQNVQSNIIQRPQPTEPLAVKESNLIQLLRDGLPLIAKIVSAL